jgi:hypothetical protein
MMSLRIPAELLARVRDAAGPLGASEWIRQAIEERLDREVDE